MHVQRPGREPVDIPVVKLGVASDPFRKEYRPLTNEEQSLVKLIKGFAADLHDLLTETGNSRELSIAKTKLEEAVFWATKHVIA